MLSRSKAAIELEHQFHDVDLMIYVEGEDDIVFWNFLKEYALLRIKLKQVGGKDNLEKYVEYAKDGGINFSVACDRDYNILIGNELHPNIFYTFGYSIENTMYCEHLINDMIFKFSRGQKHSIESVRAWMEKNEKPMEELLYFDISNEKNKLYVSTGCDSVDRFLDDNCKYLIDDKKVINYIKDIERNFTEEMISEAQLKFKEYGQSVFKCIRGHFLTSLVRNYISIIGAERRNCKKIDISNESLYTLLIGKCISCPHTCSEKVYYDNCVKRLNQNFA